MKYPARIIIISIICRTIAIIAVLAFVFGLVYISGSYSFLWLLLLIISCTYIPVYAYDSNDETQEDEKEKHLK